ncbi:MAG: alpha-glucosidase [Lachnospiraceae bacterium]|jgi:oligo-1,6-glucosidase|nr:alpha-glucosidase [Lachnospiraceae bacterium]
MTRKWWHDKVVYQIYPKSFYDTNQDGIGDIPGITAKLDYLKDLGVDILWISPCYPSPFADQGYDISDYYQIHPAFGTLEDMDRLLAAAKSRNMYILLDLVVNHCSDEHPWFEKACQDPDGEYGNFFYIEDRQDEKLPCNWRSYFGGPVWEPLPGHPDKQYLHVFHKKQPDLNWENPKVREEIYKNINWWLDRGLNGFRIDAIINIKKCLPYRDYPADQKDGLSSMDNMLEEASGIGEFLGEMRDRTFKPHNAFSVGEVFHEKPEELEDFIGENGYFSSMFDFSASTFGDSPKGWYDRTPITPEDYKNCCFQAQERIGDKGFLSNLIENHDLPRGVSYYIPREELTLESKKLLAVMYFMLRGLPFIYQGQEIGMENIEVRSIDQVDDISAVNQYHTTLNAGYSPEEAIRAVSPYSRDNARTPMQWNASPYAGFSTARPWLDVNPNYTAINAAAQEQDENSLLRFYKKLTVLRKDPEYGNTVVYGEFIPYLREQRNLMGYYRKYEHTLLVLGNMQTECQNIPLPGICKKVLLNNYQGLSINGEKITLEGWQAVILLMA